MNADSSTTAPGAAAAAAGRPSRPAPRSPSPSRSTTAAQGRWTTTGHSSAASSRRGQGGSLLSPMRSPRSRSFAASRRRRSTRGRRRAYAAVVPLIGLGAGTQIELGRGIRARVAAAGELAAHWPDAARLLPPAFGRESDRVCVLELERPLAAAEAEPPDAAGELADAVTALRLATAAPVAAGPVLFERLDWRPFGIRPVLPIAATQPSGEPSRLDSFRGKLARDLLDRISKADEDPDLSEALDRWELSLFAAEPFRSEQLREALTALLGGADGLWAATVRTALLLGETARERAEQLERLRALSAGEPAKPSTVDAIRRAVVETLLHGDREALVAALDESLLGLRARPAAFLTDVES